MRLLERSTDTGTQIDERLSIRLTEIEFHESNPGFHDIHIVNDTLPLAFAQLEKFIFKRKFTGDLEAVKRAIFGTPDDVMALVEIDMKLQNKRKEKRLCAELAKQMERNLSCGTPPMDRRASEGTPKNEENGKGKRG